MTKRTRSGTKRVVKKATKKVPKKVIKKGVGSKITARKKPARPMISPPPPSRSVEQRTKEAYERLGVTSEQVHVIPKITQILESIPKSGDLKGVDLALHYLRASDEQDARKWLNVYDELPKSARELLPLEAFCIASGVTPRRLLEVITGACMEYSSAVSQLIARTAHPDVVKATVHFAMDAQGVRDRQMLHQAHGFVPVPKNNVTHVHGNQTVNSGDGAGSVTLNTLSVESDKKMLKINDRFNEMTKEMTENRLIEAESTTAEDHTSHTVTQLSRFGD